ncbi:MAG: NAD(P)-binding domain-containing protein [Spirochaetota bacterium]|nr:MAG: NAD(P)-binding domain-containing protein [Spirochaetota bacterium]
MNRNQKKLTITLMGAGGFAGSVILNNLVKTDHNLLICEISPKAIEKIVQKRLSITAMEEAVPESDFIIMAVPDRLLGKISHDVVPRMKSDSTFILLDPAAAYAKEIALRDDCTFVVIHPCHPSLFSEYTTKEELSDKWGGVAARQDLVIGLIHGTEKNFKIAEQLSRQMFSPVDKAHRVTVEQMVILEPAMVEVVAHPAIFLMKEAMEEAINRGVPEAVVRSFMLGHINEAMWGIFNDDDTISQAAFKAIDYGTEKIIKKDWKKVFDEKSIKEVLGIMLHPDEH